MAIYQTYRLCHGCREKYTNHGQEINGIFFCTICANRHFSNNTSVNHTSYRSTIPNNIVHTNQRSQQNPVAITQSDNTFAGKIIIGFVILLIIFLSIRSCNNEQNNSKKYNTVQTVQYNDNNTTTSQKAPLTQEKIREAINAYNSGNYQSIPILQRAVNEENHAEAEFYLARALRFGNGISKDLNAAIRHYKNCANQYPLAWNTLGVIYRDNFSNTEENKRTAYTYFEKGSEYLDLFALLNYTKCIETGFGTSQNIDVAIANYKFLAKACRENANGISWNTANELREEALDKLITIIDSNYSFSKCSQLAQYLTNGLQNNEDKIYVLFHWITTNISYDTTYRIYDSENTYRYRKGVCAGYSLLLKQMCEAVGIHCEYIAGYTTDSSGRIDYSERHAWSRIYTGERYIYCDSTWAAGSVQNGTFVRCYEGKWWDSEYEIFSKTHIPE